MAQIIDTSFEPSTAGLILGTPTRTWDTYFGHVLGVTDFIVNSRAQPANPSAPGTAVIYFDSTSNKLTASENGGGYVPMVGTNPPFSDANTLIKNSGDPTKLMKFSAASITTATTRTLTVQDANYTVAGINLAQTWTANQTFSASNILASGSCVIGATSQAFTTAYFTTAYNEHNRVSLASSSFATYWDIFLNNADTFILNDQHAVTMLQISGSGASSLATLAGGLVPSTNNTRLLGSSSLRWSTTNTVNLDVSGNVTSTLKPTGSIDLGSTTAPWTNTYAITSFVRSLALTDTATSFTPYWQWHILGSTGTQVSELLDQGGATFAQFSAAATPRTASWNSHLVPFTDATFTLGTTSNRWSKTWTDVISVGATGNVGGYIDFEKTSPAPGFSANPGARMYYDGTNLKVSLNGAAYATLI